MTQFDMHPNKARRPDILAANACFLLAGAGLVLLNALSYPIVMGIYAIFGEISQPAALFWVDAVYYLPCVLLPCVLLAKKSGGRGFRLNPVHIGHGLMSIFAAIVCVFAVNSITILWSLILEGFGLTLDNTEIVMNNTADLAAAIFSMAVMPGICEELMFRGVILGAYEDKGREKALFVSSILFATLHGSVQGLPGQTLMGVVLGYVVIKSSSIYTGMMLHTTYNSLLIMITYAANAVLGGAEQPARVMDSIGGVGGLVSVIVESVISLGILYAIMRYFSRNAVEFISEDGGEIAVNDMIPAENRPKTGAAETIVLISGIVTVLYLYLTDFVYMLGY